jgi:hypothetical protein
MDRLNRIMDSLKRFLGLEVLTPEQKAILDRLDKEHEQTRHEEAKRKAWLETKHGDHNKHY